jgi:flavin-dependent dehydrogenase
MQTSNKAYDVIIIGSGLSGLSSAYFIKKNYSSLSLLIIEAKDRIGMQKIKFYVTIILFLILNNDY